MSFIGAIVAVLMILGGLVLILSSSAFGLWPVALILGGVALLLWIFIRS